MRARINGRVCRRSEGVRWLTMILAAAVSVACGHVTPRTTATNPAAVDVSHLWIDPADLPGRDLFYGAGGRELAPDPSVPFTFVKADAQGYSAGYDVRGPDGLVWSVKLGPEAQPEVAVSRLLWAIGYHQPPVYFVGRWELTGGGMPGSQEPARFRPELTDREVTGEWSWYENEFLETQPFRGLIVANLILNNWDWKTSNNKIYEMKTAEGKPSRMYVVRDLGASLGKTTFPSYLKWFPVRGFGQGTRNDVEGFESQGFIRRVEDGRIEFDYHGINDPLVEMLTPRDVVWTCELMARLSEQQWRDAFRAAGFPEEQGQRYVTKIKSKIAEGLKLRT